MKQYILPIIVCLSLLILNSCSFIDGSDDDEKAQETNAVDSFKVAQISIITENATPVISKETYVNCLISVSSNTTGWNYTGNGKIRGRGNSTWLWYPKKPYRLKLDDAAEILGINADKDWVLQANYRDPTQLMNTFVFTVGQGLGLPYTNRTRYVEVTLNGSYIGLYQLTEQVEQGINRVAISPTEGVLLSLDADDGPELAPEAIDNFLSSVYRMPVCVKNPEITSSTQLLSIRSSFALLEDAIRNADYDALEKRMDIKSFIDYMLIHELVYNVEVDAPRSIFLFLDIDGRWKMGPLWDFDAGFDFDWDTMYTGHNYFATYKELVLGTDPVNHINGYNVPSFFTDLFRNKRFVVEYKARWLVIRDKVMSEYWITTQKYADNISDAMIRDIARWPIDKNYKTEIPRMKQWLTNRVNYLSTIIANYPAGTK